MFNIAKQILIYSQLTGINVYIARKTFEVFDTFNRSLIHFLLLTKRNHYIDYYSVKEVRKATKSSYLVCIAALYRYEMFFNYNKQIENAIQLIFNLELNECSYLENPKLEEYKELIKKDSLKQINKSKEMGEEEILSKFSSIHTHKGYFYELKKGNKIIKVETNFFNNINEEDLDNLFK